MSADVDVLVIGAGQAGLAVSHELDAAGVEHVVLEADRIGRSWAQRWDSFCLVTSNHTIRLPGGEYQGPDAAGFLGFPVHEGGRSIRAPGLWFVGMPWLSTRKSPLLLGVGRMPRRSSGRSQPRPELRALARSAPPVRGAQAASACPWPASTSLRATRASSAGRKASAQMRYPWSLGWNMSSANWVRMPRSP